MGQIKKLNSFPQHLTRSRDFLPFISSLFFLIVLSLVTSRAASTASCRSFFFSFSFFFFCTIISARYRHSSGDTKRDGRNGRFFIPVSARWMGVEGDALPCRICAYVRVKYREGKAKGEGSVQFRTLYKDRCNHVQVGHAMQFYENWVSEFSG